MAKILSVITYPFYPPSNGGQLRCYYLLCSLAADHDVYVLTVQPVSDFTSDSVVSFPKNITLISIASEVGIVSFLNILFPKKYADAIHARLISRSLTTRSNDFLSKAYPVVRNICQKILFDAVVYENLEGLVFMRNVIKRIHTKALHLLDAHNVDSSLWMQYSAIEKSEILKRYAAKALAYEKKLNKLTDHVFACSLYDAEVLKGLNNGKLKTTVVPNGVDIENKPYDQDERKAYLKELIFCGSLSTHANREGLLWFYRDIFPLIRDHIPEVTLTVIGQLFDYTPFLELKNDSSVHFIGQVDSVNGYYRRCSVAVVPLRSGSGTRLKILEAMSFGNPVVSTAKGAEGIFCEDGIDIIIADSDTDFANKVVRLLQNKSLFDSMRMAARKLVEDSYDWRIIGSRMSTVIKDLTRQNLGT
jgi:glycosyltransferase involved in cell wall biosynthesis